MDHSDPHQDVADLANEVGGLEIRETAPAVPDKVDSGASEGEANPWAEQAGVVDLPVHRLKTPDPEALEAEMAPVRGLEGDMVTESEEPRGRVSEEVLNEFDPLAVKEETDARMAWHDQWAKDHPASPPSSPPSPIPDHGQTDKVLPQTPSPPTSASISAFPSLASFVARSFTLPKQRPKSMDSPATMLSPTSITSFATQQQQTKASSEPGSADDRQDTPPPPANSSKDKENDKPPPFDFQKFLEQMKLKSAEPVAKYLRSFLSNFAKRTFTVNDQVRIINEFLNFISGEMRKADVWKHASDAEFDNAMEAMEKLVMNRLYEFTFTPAIAKSIPPRPITTDDLERDRVLEQRMSLFGWIEEKHLDVPDGEGTRGFLDFAASELLKINHYKAPRDKLVCILNCCKVIFGLIRHTRSEEGADSFVPILIFVVLKANPPHLLSNVEYINRFRNPQRLQSEAGYYLSSLMGSVSFIETMDHTSLSNITPEEFELNVEEAIQRLPETPPANAHPAYSQPTTPARPTTPSQVTSPHAGEESAQPLALPTPGQGASLANDTRRFLQKTGDTISKPLNALGRIFNEVLDSADEKLTYLPGPFAPFEMGRENRSEREQEQHWAHPEQVRRFAEAGGSGSVPQTPVTSGDGTLTAPVQTPYKPRVRPFGTPPPSAQSTGSFGFTPDSTPSRIPLGPSQQHLQPQAASPHPSRTPTPNLDLTGLQAEIDRAHEKAATASRGTLLQIFPSTDREVIEWVLEANEGDLGRSIEALLEMTGGT
ncbi:hypothetical protein BD410DRAFT_532816 [Rickenella mellea]|uniref:VPS9 domain-containing protein n=1 Tax=Rickenella mellea TaxID=50990 RepID=A0A4Y7QGC4_9AGAM|nr:hypothetical protein BD410DRAFT_532816 [Rickenella mellea]